VNISRLPTTATNAIAAAPVAENCAGQFELGTIATPSRAARTPARRPSTPWYASLSVTCVSESTLLTT
jgi:hypothetical protein